MIASQNAIDGKDYSKSVASFVAFRNLWIKPTAKLVSKPTKVLHISAECYPAAKTGGLADVVGALPKYQQNQAVVASVVIPKYDLPWINKQQWSEVFSGGVWMGFYDQPFKVYSIDPAILGFPLFCIELLGKFDRPGIYSDPYGNYYGDEAERFVSFQKSVLRWLQSDESIRPDIMHCHDHHTGLIPFMVKHSPEFQNLAQVPTVFTIHNGRYHGSFGWHSRYLLPHFDDYLGGLLEWKGVINPLAAAIKCCWRLTTVSRAYLEELKTDSNGLEWLLQQESFKSNGILNGIDTVAWDPATDPSLKVNLKKSVPYFKRENKASLVDTFHLEKKLPLIAFIGRFAIEKGADVLPDLVYRTFSQNYQTNMLILGSGEPPIQHALDNMARQFAGRFSLYLGYNEDLAHQIYAGADFLVMPSRVEPCGLNQMYALRYGTIPIVRRTGGLRDSVVDIGDPGGSGLMFNHVLTSDILHAFSRALELYENKKKFNQVIQKNMQLDFSWDKSAEEYQKIYDEIKIKQVI
ncbi:MAG: glycosyltransferase [Saprospiraceae bacterium]|nr:glycosyltransferase [Saprospiraceae bacterium]